MEEEEEATEAGCGEQFRAAVRVIQGLPRSGDARPDPGTPFSSPHGCCPPPPLRDAWHSLGRMSKEEAMAAYVAEMKKVAQKIIDTVPMDETTEEMFQYFEPLYEVIHDMPRPPEAFFKRKKGEWEPLCPACAQHVPHLWATPLARHDSLLASGDVYCDTLEQMEPEQVTEGWEALGALACCQPCPARALRADLTVLSAPHTIAAPPRCQLGATTLGAR
uniref:Acyl-CoA-binding domain-containing protein 4 n=1 Tax=Calidris pygmaea TaxID=425635 RepID=A0A8C3KLR2_9CHAR